MTSLVIHFKRGRHSLRAVERRATTITAGGPTREKPGDVMFALLKSFFHMEFFAECGRLLLLSVSASYVGANVRRLATKHGWDHHLLYLVYFVGTARRWQAREKRWLWRAGLKNWRMRGNRFFVIPGWSEGPDPESRDSPMCNCTSEVRASRAPE